MIVVHVATLRENHTISGSFTSNDTLKAMKATNNINDWLTSAEDWTSVHVASVQVWEIFHISYRYSTCKYLSFAIMFCISQTGVPKA